ncbi:MAG: TIGR00730 family Rossman fold protein [Chloroflexi bacterium]|nr:TIGR00730 family Rossman fold protein [Chloroflexota bacterium]
MAREYEINALAKEESWRMFRIIGELVEGFDRLSGIEPAVSFYGSARIKPGDKLYTQTTEIARRLGEMGFSIVSGGGPGVMEAANKGASEAGVTSVGLNIELAEPQPGNPYINKSLTFSHFFVRKVMLVKYASAFIIMPGGLGTLDELTEVLTLMQTRKIRPFPVILFDGQYWEGFLDWLHGQALARGLVSEEDFALLRVCDTPDGVIEAVQKWYIKHEIVGRKAVVR